MDVLHNTLMQIAQTKREVDALVPEVINLLRNWHDEGVNRDDVINAMGEVQDCVEGLGSALTVLSKVVVALWGTLGADYDKGDDHDV
jgi:GTP1/Obg family GTP-binding protein